MGIVYNPREFIDDLVATGQYTKAEAVALARDEYIRRSGSATNIRAENDHDILHRGRVIAGGCDG